jgi:hypothetical protein
MTAEPEASVYRCVHCGDGKRLMAWAPANVYGPVAADGDLAQHDDVWDMDGVHEDSIQCTEHPDCGIEKYVDGKWCCWWNCPKCKGTGRVGATGRGPAPDGYPCRAETFKGSNTWGSWGVHSGWFPVEEVARVMAAWSPPPSAELTRKVTNRKWI